MKRKLLFFINPVSGVKKKPLLKAAISKKMEEHNIDFEMTDTRTDGNYAGLNEQIRRQKITDIVICGGDGSVSTITSFLLNTDIRVGIIPMGSGNGLAFAAGIPSSSIKALDIIVAGNSSYIDGFFINDRFSCMMCGIGSDAQVAHDFASQKRRGLQTYLKLSALHYFKSKPYSFAIKTGTESFETDAFFIVIANSNQFGNNVTIAPKASLNDGLLDIVIVNKMHKLVLPFALLNQIAGINTLTEIKNYNKNNNIVYFQSSELTIINKGNAPIHIDGEPGAVVEKVKIKIRPNAFRLLQPF
jgi:diacylglycerol kinase (ATP)